MPHYLNKIIERAQAMKDSVESSPRNTAQLIDLGVDIDEIMTNMGWLSRLLDEEIHAQRDT